MFSSCRSCCRGTRSNSEGPSEVDSPQHSPSDGDIRSSSQADPLAENPASIPASSSSQASPATDSPGSWADSSSFMRAAPSFGLNGELVVSGEKAEGSGQLTGVGLAHSTVMESVRALSERDIGSITQQLEKWCKLGTRDEKRDVAQTRMLEFFNGNGSKVLDLKGLGLTSLPAWYFGIPSIGEKLQNLVLSSNHLKSLPYTIFHLKGLNTLDVRHNGLTQLPRSISGLRKLEVLDLSENEFHDFPQEVLFCSHLGELSLANNSISTLPEDCGSLPSTLESLRLDGNSITRLGDGWRQFSKFCVLHLLDNPIEDEELSKLCSEYQSPEYEGPKLGIVVNPHSDYFKDLKYRLQLLFGGLDLPIPDILSVASTRSDCELLSLWLQRMVETAEYSASSRDGKIALRHTIVDIIRQAQENREYRRIFRTIVSEATSKCGDRISLSILYLGLERRKVALDRTNIAAVAGFMSGLWAMGILEEFAKALGEGPEEVETYLAYPVLLKDRLGLPIDVSKMRFRSYSKVRDEHLSQAEAVVKSTVSDVNQFASYLAEQDIWKETLEVHFPDESRDILARYEAELDSLEALPGPTLKDYQTIRVNLEQQWRELSLNALYGLVL